MSASSAALVRRPGAVPVRRTAVAGRGPAARRVVSVDPTVALYRRRRVGVAVFVVAFVVALLLSFSAVGSVGVADRGGDPASAAAVGPSGSTYVVQPGDTLWSIAERLYPGSSTAEVADLLASRNGGASLEVGQRLVLP